ncbi:hypothetical protein AOLI_G00003150 [Acnodon oligacanthus]
MPNLSQSGHVIQCPLKEHPEEREKMATEVEEQQKNMLQKNEHKIQPEEGSMSRSRSRSLTGNRPNMNEERASVDLKNTEGLNQG